jgi:predicted NUDIX family NTP pyrophosphohydrolase
MKKAAGILLFRTSPELQVLLVHPGGPFWGRKNEGVWSIPKGEPGAEEDDLECAIREFEEETGKRVEGEFIPLKPCRQKSGKLVQAWALRGDFDPDQLKSNDFEIEWPPKSGKLKKFPEVDKAAWFSLTDAQKMINPGQVSLLDQIRDIVT